MGGKEERKGNNRIKNDFVRKDDLMETEISVLLLRLQITTELPHFKVGVAIFMLLVFGL